MTTGLEEWKFYIGYKGQIPTDEELKKFKVLIFPGSGSSAYDKSQPWIEKLGNLVRHVYTNFPHIKMFGGCFGSQLFAQYLKGKVEKMVLGPDRPKILGRERIKMTDAFFEMPYV
jgi:GMP synthase-like glutamine amidotransferase